MRAAYIESLGPPENMRYGVVPDPVPGPTDVFVRSGVFATTTPFPFVVSRDLVGTVRSAGPATGGFAPGEWVWCNSLGHAGRQGAAAECAVVPADRLYHVPEGADPLEMVTTVHPAATAYLALFTHGRVRPGETVVVAGAAGNVGAALVVLAAYAGARVLAVASEADGEYCRRLGAAEAFDYRDPLLSQKIRDACEHGVDVYLDTSGTNDLTTAVELLAFRGRIILLAGARTRPTPPAGALYMKDGSVVGFVISHATTGELAEAAARLNQLLPTGVLRPRAIRREPLSAATHAHHMMEAGTLRGTRLALMVRDGCAGSGRGGDA